MIHWLTTAPNPKYLHKTHSADDGQRGWRLHAVDAAEKETFADIGRRAALCGLTPGTGWGVDLFIERRCANCERAAARKGMAIPPESSGWRTV